MESMAEVLVIFNSDNPITQRDKDILDRGKFAENVAKAITAYNGHESLTIGIFGGWGNGKTSLSNLILSELPDEKYAIIKFNPWMYSDKGDLISNIFERIEKAFKAPDVDSTINTIADKIDKVGSLIKIGKYIPILSEAAKDLSNIFSEYAELLKGTTNKEITLDSTKNKIDEVLKKSNLRLVFVIDDIDRLTKEEIRQLFQAIKALGDFQNTIYLLLMDEEVVVNSLEGIQGGKGEDYLRKIIQIPINIPEISRSQLKNIILNKIAKIIPDERFEKIQIEFDEIIENCISPFIKNIRDINRIINAYEFKNSFLKNEVYEPDLLAICVFEHYIPSVFEWIRNNKFKLTTHGDLTDSLEAIKTNFDKELVNKAVSAVFPNAFMKSKYKSPIETKGLRRIMNRDIFDAYFSLSIPSEFISIDEIEYLVYQAMPEEIQNTFESTQYSIVELLKEIEVRYVYLNAYRAKILIEITSKNYGLLIFERKIDKRIIQGLSLKLISRLEFNDVRSLYREADFGDQNSKEVILFVDLLITQERLAKKWGLSTENEYYNFAEGEALISLEKVCQDKFKHIDIFSYDFNEFYWLLFAWEHLDHECCKLSVVKNLNTFFNVARLIGSKVSMHQQIYASAFWQIEVDEIEQYITKEKAYQLVNIHENDISVLDDSLRCKVTAFCLYMRGRTMKGLENAVSCEEVENKLTNVNLILKLVSPQ